VLSLIDAQGKPQDGFPARERIYNLKLPAELVVLSAARPDSAKTSRRRPGGTYARLLMYSGAARVVVSLWNENDKATPT